MVFAAAFVGVAFLFLAATYYFSAQVIHIQIHRHEAVLQEELDAGRLTKEQLQALPMQEVDIPSPFGYVLRGYWIPPASPLDGETDPPQHAAVFVHGVTSSSYGMLKYAELLRKRGYAALVYDHRRHGRSGGTSTTYGYMEKQDLKAVVDWVVSRCGKETVIGIYGESMGASTALEHLGIDDRAAFYILDCPYADLTDQFAYRLKVQYRLPAFPLLGATSLWCKLRAGFFFHEVSPLRQVRKSGVPILFIHGEKDDYVPTSHTMRLYEAAPRNKRLFIAPGAAHAQSIAADPAGYEAAVHEFLRSFGLLPEAAMDKEPAIHTKGREANDR